MKRHYAIFLLVILLFNSFGYSIVCSILQTKSDYLINARLEDDNYDESKLIEIKIPLKLPYSTEWKHFERFDGEIEINNVYYKYVKRKVIVDSLVLLCLPDPVKSQYKSAREKAYDLVNGLKHPTNKKTNSVLKIVKSEYITETHISVFNPFTSINKAYRIFNTLSISFYHLHKLIKPPSAAFNA